MLAVFGGVFGAWSSSMIGISIPSPRLERFESAIAQGRILLMVDVPYIAGASHRVAAAGRPSGGPFRRRGAPRSGLPLKPASEHKNAYGRRNCATPCHRVGAVPSVQSLVAVAAGLALEDPAVLQGRQDRTLAMAIAIALIVLALGSVLFHFLSPWYFTPIASNWGTIDTTISITFWVTGIVFVAVSLFMALAVIRYRHREERTRSVPAGEQEARVVAPGPHRRAAWPPCWRRASWSGRTSSTCRRTPRSWKSWPSSGTGVIACRARTASWGPCTPAS